MDTKIINTLIEHIAEGPSYDESFINFVKKLVRNPCSKCIDKMHDFIGKHCFSVTKEGYVCGFSTSDKCAFGLNVVPLENAQKEAEFFQKNDLFIITFEPADVLEVCDEKDLPFMRVKKIKRAEKIRVPRHEATKVREKIVKKFSGVFEKLTNS